MAPDTWMRHRIVSRLAGNPRTLLDVGGVAGELQAFMPRTRIVTANVQPGADVLFDGRTLPFGDREFDAVVSLDVLEHVPPAGRQGHLDDIARVARDVVVLCCPLGGPEHEAAERDLAAWHRAATGRPHRFLEEHLHNGLPTLEELRLLAEGSPAEFEVLFHGDFTDANELFRLATEVKRRPHPAAVARYAAARFRPSRDTTLQPRAGPRTNRAYLVSRVLRGSAAADPAGPP